MQNSNISTFIDRSLGLDLKKIVHWCALMDAERNLLISMKSNKLAGKMKSLALLFPTKSKSHIHKFMGVGAQKDLGGHQTFARKMRLNFARKAIGFSFQIKVTSKKKQKKHKSSLKLRRFDKY